MNTAMKFSLDPTGISPENLVTDELVTTVRRDVRAIVPEYGSFFANSVKLIDLENNQELVRGIHFFPAEMYAVETAKYGKEICAIILLVDAAVSTNLKLHYQALGGEGSYSIPKMRAFIDSVENTSRVINWKDVSEKPKEYSPSPHQHDRDDVYGLEYVQAAIDRISTDIPAGMIQTSNENNQRNINAFFNEAVSRRNAIISQALDAHKADAYAHIQYAKAEDVALAYPLVNKPVIVAPANGAFNVARNVALAGSPYYSFYGVEQKSVQVQVSTQSSFVAAPLLDKTELGIMTSVQPPTLLPAGTLLYVRMRYCDEENIWSAWSPTSSFTTA